MNKTNSDNKNSLYLTPDLLHEALEQLGWQGDTKALADRVKRLNIGLPAEDEFSLLLTWLGKCRLVHKLDQVQIPNPFGDKYKVPDLLAVMDYKGQGIPVLIEVKTKKGNLLKWRPDYFEGLLRYSQQIGLPILVAWKYFDIWVMFELKHFARQYQNYRIDFQTAAKQNLMGLLAGDFVYIFKQGVGMHWKMRKETMLKREKIGEGHYSEEWIFRVEDVHFTNGAGEQITRLEWDLWALFNSIEQEQQTDIDEKYLHNSFVIPEGGAMQFAHRGLVELLLCEAQREGPSQLRWRELLQSQRLPIESSELRNAAVRGISEGFIQYVVNWRPNSKPDFLAERAVA